MSTTLDYTISLDDEASTVYKKFVEQAKAGSADIQKTMDAASEAVKRHAKETSKLTQWIREERTEQREHNFIFRQGQEVIGALSIGMAAFGTTLGNSSAQMRNMTDAANQGFIVFQGVNNAVGLMGLGGPWGIAISAVAGIAAAFAQVSSKGEEARKILSAARREIFELQFQSGTQSNSAMLAELERDRAKALADLNKLTTTISTMVSTGNQYKPEGSIILKVVGTPEQITAAEKALAQASQKLQQFKNTMAKDLGREVDAPTLIWEMNGALEQLGETAPRVAVDLDSFWTKWRKNMQSSKSPVDAMMADFKAFVTEAEKIAAQDAQIMQQVMQIGIGGMQAGFEAMFAGQEAALRKAFKGILLGAVDLVQGMLLAAAATMPTKGILSWFTSLATDVPAFIAATAGLQLLRAFVASTFHQGGMVGQFGQRVPFGPDERPIVVKVGATVRTREQEARVRGGGGGVTINFYGPVSDHRWVKELVERGLRETGLTPDKYFTDTSKGIALT
jgi:hypothetical protein